MAIKSFVVGPLQTNTYLIIDDESRRAAAVDPGMGSEPVLGYLERQGLTLDYIIDTHGHVDHIFNNAYFKKSTQAKLLIHPEDVFLLEKLVANALLWGMRATASPPPDELLEDGQMLLLGNLSFKVIHTPGHSPGGVCLYLDGAVMVGDTLFAGSIGRTDIPGGSLETLLNSVRAKLFALPDETIVYPGHGPSTTIGEEKRFNPFFQRSVPEILRWFG